MGEHVVNKEPDGSGEEPNQPTQHTRQSEANKPGAAAIIKPALGRRRSNLRSDRPRRVANDRE